MVYKVDICNENPRMEYLCFRGYVVVSICLLILLEKERGVMLELILIWEAWNVGDHV